MAVTGRPSAVDPASLVHQRTVVESKLPPSSDERPVREQGNNIRPQNRDELENRVSIAWHSIPRSDTPWSDQADGPCHFTGDGRFHLDGRPAGTFVSAHQAGRARHAQVAAGWGPIEKSEDQTTMKTMLAGMLLSVAAVAAPAPKDVLFTGESRSPISYGVAVPAGRACFWTSGTVPSEINRDGRTVHERYGDTYTQGVSCLKNIERVLGSQGLGLKDVVYLRVYIVPDAARGGKADFAGWFKAYGEFFNTGKNPVKVARATVAVAGLVNADWLIEIEAVAVYPD